MKKCYKVVVKKIVTIEDMNKLEFYLILTPSSEPLESLHLHYSEIILQIVKNHSQYK